ncbi:mannose 6-phosphate receptor domain-containing protein [Melanomma pulvis-pyrius CBS 109.77]|uniref:Mannose 6-phosphate receptor domain-containing protein n=1 Tax=Melanomma pulvis-pyrius CBS 109.77 TaxID=1314802 RepID=A0A6A6XW27_9PLEO|nr:mannose 6-phosphate receptor domain-containing protein [Melanomma pulvis-pyrius CBS 109.77]
MKAALWSALLCLLATADFSAASDTSKATKPLKPCTVRSPTTERYFDLNPIHRKPKDPGDKRRKEDEAVESWHARGYDYGANFTINFCGPVVETLTDVQDLDRDLWKNVSAYYEIGSKQYALGLESYEPIFRGRKLVLNYTGGSLCPSKRESKRALFDPNDDVDERDDRDKEKDRPKEPERRKTTVISLLCEKAEPIAKTSISFVAAVDECVYFFEGRSPHACGGVEAETQALGPGGVFGVIILIAVLVYLVGGWVYQRTVMHQRGWRQLPNYQLWAGIWGFLGDMFIILTSSCARFLPSRRGYSRVSLGHDSGRHGRRNDDEDRLIDNLDEEWDD